MHVNFAELVHYGVIYTVNQRDDELCLLILFIIENAIYLWTVLPHRMHNIRVSPIGKGWLLAPVKNQGKTANNAVFATTFGGENHDIGSETELISN